MPTKIKRDPYGKLVGFDGSQVKHYKEEPAGFFNNLQEYHSGIDGLLPFEAFACDMELTYFRGDRRCCVCLYDKFNTIVHQWPENHIPTHEEVRGQAAEYLKSIGRRIF